MIRINLLGIPKTKRGKRPAAPASMGDGPSTTMLVLIFLVAVGAGLWSWYSYVNKQRETANQELRAAQAENLRLAEVKTKYEAEQRTADLFRQRCQVIDQLKHAQSGPVDLLNMVADTITKTDAVWLEAMTNDGKSIDFTGLALSPDAVANLMANLEKTGKFKSVEIKEASQDTQFKELQAFKFELICELGAPTAPSPTTAPAAGPKIDKKLG